MKQIFQQMYRYIEQHARGSPQVCGTDLHFPENRHQLRARLGIRLYVEKSNDRAKQCYSSVGMSPAHYDIFETDFVFGENATK